MPSVFFRGAKSSPRWFVRFKDASGKWRSRRVRQETRREALAIARQLEAQAERRAYGIEPPEHASTSVRVLMER